jgi:hypothetical protein
MTQEQWILSALRRGKKLTAWDALKGCRCFRLAARVSDLRKQGFRITTEMVYAGGKVFARYKLNKRRG